MIKVDRFFPSSKTCHCCGWKWEDMGLTDRVFVCQHPHVRIISLRKIVITMLRQYILL